MLQKEHLTFVIPIFNEADCLPELMRRLLSLRERMPQAEVRFLFVNDGSRDGSPALLDAYARTHPFVQAIHFSRNFGHQIAVTAGLDHAEADWVCIIDADLQDPPELVEEMLRLAKSGGADIVYGKRRERKGETAFKRLTASVFYRLIRSMCGIDIPEDTGDFRLIDRSVVKAIRRMRETHRFLRGMVPWVGFRSVPLLYDRDQRYAGETKYPLRKMLNFALDAIFSFSNKPLRLASWLGLAVISCGFLGFAYIVFLKLFTDRVVPGITVLLTAVLTVGGFQIIMLGVMGEYLGRVFEEVKRRPLYLIGSTRNLEPPPEGA